MARSRPQCDICAAVVPEGTPMGATVTLDETRPTTDMFSAWFGESSKSAVKLDLCLDCAGPLVSLLREKKARLEAARGKAPARTTPSDVYLASLNDMLRRDGVSFIQPDESKE
jgi:hypothetical protein